MPAPDPEDQTLETLLAFHGLSYWLPLLREWCGRFEGWYVAYELWDEPTADFVPTTQLMLALSQRTESLNGSDYDFAVLLTDLDFVCWYARIEDTRERWDPFAETFRSFSSRGKAYLWQDDHAFVAPTAIRGWLLGRMDADGSAPPAPGAAPGSR